MNIIEKALIFTERILFPPCCLVCGKMGKKIWCKDCMKIIKQNEFLNVEHLNSDDYYFEDHIYFFKYKKIIRSIILDYKFNDKSYLYKIFSQIIINNKKIFGILKKYDIIIPVPIHKTRKKKRGYNQSELISKEIALKVGINYMQDCLIKIKNTKEQSSLDKKERKQNIKDAYKIINRNRIKNKRIILFDDVFTTGNTVNECAKILKENGARRIIVVTIAKD